MILDSNLTFCRATDAPTTVTTAIPLGQADLEGNSKGMVPYNGLVLHVSAGEDIAAMTVTLETSDTESGAYETVRAYPEKMGIKAGQMIVNDKLPWECRNWVRLAFSVANKVNAHLALDTDKKYPVV